MTDSPCESALTLVKIRLFDPQGRPLPFAPCVITETGQAPKAARATGASPAPLGTTAAVPPGGRSGGNKEEGLVTVRVQKLPTTVNLRWSRPKETEQAGAPLPNPADLDDFEFTMDVIVDVPTDVNQGARSRLKNLGYDTNPPKPVPGFGDPITAFQRDYQKQFPDIVVDGTLNQPTIDDSQIAHDANDPVLRAGSDVTMKR
ncbi:MAG: hypothetical protein H7039_10500 [Bryobacteraceae bacterium]|nr:hypothetical protein [Bryobacteraceae bacterium]